MSYNPKYNWEQFQFRASCLTKIMAGCIKPGHSEAQDREYQELQAKKLIKPLTPLQEIKLNCLKEKLTADLELGASTKTILDAIWHEQVTGRRQILIGEQLTKGTLREEEAIAYINKVRGTNYQKWSKGKLGLPSDTDIIFGEEVSLINGEPDIVTDNFIIDVKCSWDYFSHVSKTEGYFHSSYYYQLLAYMHLTGLKSSFIASVLLSHTPEYITREQQKLLTHHEVEKLTKQLEVNSIYDDLPDNFRVVIYEFGYSEQRAKLMFEYLKLCKEYLKTKTLM